MSRLTDLIAQAKAKDPQMGADLEREFKALSSRLPFGLNFERHRPEAEDSDDVKILRPDFLFFVQLPDGKFARPLLPPLRGHVRAHPLEELRREADRL